MALKTGVKAPDFTLKNHDGEEICLAELLKSGPLVLFFFPRAFTRVCTAEACSFGERLDRFDGLNATVVGISTDDVPTLARFREQYGLNYIMLSDTKAKVSKAYDVYVPILGFSSRVTYVIDSDGVIKGVHSGMFQAEPHIRKSLQTLKQD